MESANFPITIVGFGSQAKAWAMNLSDSKQTVKIALAKNSPSQKKAQDLGFQVIDLESDALKNESVLVLLIPDDQHLAFLQKNQSYLRKDVHLIYAHGFSFSKFNLAQRYPQFSHSLLAPKAIASEVRYQYGIKGKIGAAYYASNEALEKQLKNISLHVGFTALYQSHFEEETKADLFSEQSLLCSILPYVSLKSFNKLRENGISQEVAFMECFLELKSISQALVTLGPIAFFQLISPNALIGSQKGRDLLLGSQFDAALDILMKDILSKKFFNEVEVDVEKLRETILDEWQKEEMVQVFDKLKNDLIN